MKSFELFYLGVKRFLPVLHVNMGKRVKQFAVRHGNDPEILDVGGRKSHYTIGVPAKITLSDIPRETDVQKGLNLGINHEMVEETQSRRSNIKTIVFDDMTKSNFPDATFDCVVAVEVLEHVEEDAKFVAEVYRVLKPGGEFLMSTPNGDFVENHNVDHKRHYKREQLRELLEDNFEQVEVDYAILGGFWRTQGLKSWSLKHPLRTFFSMVGNLVNSFQSASPTLKNQAEGTHHLVAWARKAEGKVEAPEEELAQERVAG